MNKAGLFLFSLLLFACSNSTPPEESVTRAHEYLKAGDSDAATGALRDAVRADPDDADIRLMLAEAYLSLGDGKRASATLDQALARGLDPDRASLPYARASYLNGKFVDLIAQVMPLGLDPAERVHFLYLQAEARAELSAADPTNDEVIAGYVDLFEAIGEQSEDSQIAEVSDKLEAARNNREDIDRAWQHFECSSRESRSVGWNPLDRVSDRVLQVGPEKKFKTIAAAAKEARDGDIIEIDAGTYRGGVALWPQDNLIVRGIGERPVVTADGRSIESRDVWLFTGDNVVIENIEISGARSPWENGAGIRHMGSGLTLRHVFLHGNENGVLTSNRFPDANEILIEYSEFASNGDNKGLAHNIYIGRSKRFELRYSYSHGSQGGHLVKSRAQENLIAYNRLTDEEGGRSSYIVDIPEGGLAAIIGNVIEQGAATLNHGMVSYAAESNERPDNRLSIVNNSIYNRDYEGVVVRNPSNLEVVMANNLLGGAPVQTTDSAIKHVNNLMLSEHGMADPRNYDYGLVDGAPAIDAGVDFDIFPAKEYVHPAQWRDRQNVWRIDIGAYERCGIN